MKQLMLILFLTFLIAAGYIVLIEPNMIVTRELNIQSPGIERRLRIMLVSDLHIHGIWLREFIVLNIARAIKPDMIIVAGDLIESPDGVEAAVSLIRAFSGVSRVVVVWGNWDHWSGVNLKVFRRKLEEHGATVLVNEALTLEEWLTVAGVDDPYTGHADLDKALNSQPPGFRLLVAHSPQIIGLAAGRVDLVLTGHTHGGQVAIPFIGSPFIPLPGKYRGYVYGLYVVNGTLLYVTRGVGTSFLPVRLMCPPEVALITLEAGS